MQITRSVRWLIFALVLMAVPASSFAGVFISVNIAPPVLPVYVQPACPGAGYIWTPGYWAYGPDGYYWVPGTWVMAPEPGLLWTPGYWGWSEGVYVWHAGYWGPHVGFYGGVNYGLGYFGVGFLGGEWHGREFYYNRSVTNVNITNVHIYNKTVINNVTVNRVAYNGGPGGINVRPRPEEERAMHERHFEPTSTQVQHENGARNNRELLASVNHGRPAIAATVRPAEFHGRGVVAARAAGAPYRPENRAPENRANDRAMNRPNNAMDRGNDRAMNRTAPRPPNSGRADSGRPMDRPQSARNMDRPSNMGRPENHGGPPTSSYRQETSRPQPHESAPRPEKEQGGHEHKGR